tara:strand:+ start:62 stop:1285 length:1224 start_codon:yes stop_codon:yes gene_type:complete
MKFLFKHILLITICTILTIACKNEKNNLKKFPSINIISDKPINWKIKEKCKIIYSDKNQEDELGANIKFRGGFSSKYYKHSFSLELDDKYQIGNIPVDDDWILNANYIDKTFMRHKISYDIYREMSPTNVSAKSSYINVSINGNYQGLYVIMEEINASMIGLNKNDSLAMLFKGPPIFKKDIQESTKTSLNYYQQKYPKIKDSNKQLYIEKFIDFIFNSNDNEFAKNISNWIDLQNFIDWQIILLFSNNGDGLLKNFYLYKKNKDTPFRIAIWDYDHSYGRDGDNELNFIRRKIKCNRSIIFDRLTSVKKLGYINKLKKRWFYLRNSGIISTNNFINHCIKNNHIIKDEIKNNFKIWPLDGKWYFDNNNYKQEINLMIEYVKIRIPQLDKYFSSIETKQKKYIKNIL